MMLQQPMKRRERGGSPTHGAVILAQAALRAPIGELGGGPALSGSSPQSAGNPLCASADAMSSSVSTYLRGARCVAPTSGAICRAVSATR
jgi:hypothetical protein